MPKKQRLSFLQKFSRLSNKAKLLLFVAVFGVLGGGYLVYSTSASTVSNNLKFSNIQLGKVTPGSGHIGVDIWYPKKRLFRPAISYVPCHHNEDPSYGACQLSKNGPISYYKVLRFKPDGTNFPYGIFIDNKNENRCILNKPWCEPKVKSYTHYWGNKVDGGAVEIYPHAPGTENFDPTKNTVGGVRIQVSGFPIKANGGRYSQDLGNVKLPKLGEPGVGKLNGLALVKGKRVAKDRVTFDFFQNGSSRETSTGYPMSGFSSSSNNQNAYYTSGALPVGSYKLYVTDNETGHKIILDGLEIINTNQRLDFELTKKCFGYAHLNCTDPAS